uniref:Putative histone acetyltransferase kat7 isoform x1 n=1 Tax=Lutzomyia longipalpis TaxID=7200 RepID=A0A1B0CTL8_LUTLO
MSSRKKSTTSTESSGSSSESSTTSEGSSSGSDSGSTSSDDSDTSSSQRSRASESGSAQPPEPPKNETKGSQATKVAPRRRSSEVIKAQHQSKSEEKPPANRSRDRLVSASATKVMQQKVAKNAMYSSDDDASPPKIPPPAKKAGGQDASKKRPLPQSNRPKNVPSSVSGAVPPSTGGKAPPSVLKQHQQSMGALSKVVTGSKSIVGGVKSTAQAPKTAPEKHTGQSSKVKKKSIFSPDNSSDSEDAAAGKNSRQPAKSKQVAKPAPQKVGKAPITPAKTTRKMSSKSSAESSATSTTTTDDSSESDSETASSEDSSPPAKKMAVKKTAPKGTGSVKPPEEPGKNHVNTDSEPEPTSKPTVARKLTRSSSTRKSKHLTGKAPSDTDSEVDETKRQSSKSPVKKAPVVSSKGKAKNTTKRQDTAKVNSNTTPPAQIERKCPFEGCDSSGHLGGQYEKHFTIEACPLYHNMTPAEAKLAFVERKKRDEERRKAMAAYDPTKKVPTAEQKAYLQKIRESRAKHKIYRESLEPLYCRISHLPFDRHTTILKCIKPLLS